MVLEESELEESLLSSSIFLLRYLSPQLVLSSGILQYRSHLVPLSSGTALLWYCFPPVPLSSGTTLLWRSIIGGTVLKENSNGGDCVYMRTLPHMFWLVPERKFYAAKFNSFLYVVVNMEKMEWIIHPSFSSQLLKQDGVVHVFLKIFHNLLASGLWKFSFYLMFYVWLDVAMVWFWSSVLFLGLTNVSDKSRLS